MAFKVLVFLLTLCSCVLSKVYDRCELANELKNVYKFPEEQIATWVCIARHESEFNTSAVGHLNWDGSGDHGLFQISDLFWCSPPGKGWACGVTCEQLEDDDIADDVACVRRIYRQHQRLSGDGFTAWAVYRVHCTSDRVSEYVEGCSDATTTVKPDVDNNLIKTEDTDDISNQVVETEKKEVEAVKPEEKIHITRMKDVVKQHMEMINSEDVKQVPKIAITPVKIVELARSYDGFSAPKPKSTKRYFASLFEYVYKPT